MKKERTEKHKQQFEGAKKRRAEQILKRRQQQEEEEKQRQKELEEKIVKKAIILKKKQIKAQKILEEIPDEEPEEPKTDDERGYASASFARAGTESLSRTDKSIERLKQVHKKVAVKPAVEVYKPKFKFIN